MEIYLDKNDNAYLLMDFTLNFNIFIMDRRQNSNNTWTWNYTNINGELALF